MNRRDFLRSLPLFGALPFVPRNKLVIEEDRKIPVVEWTLEVENPLEEIEPINGFRRFRPVGDKYHIKLEGWGKARYHRK